MDLCETSVLSLGAYLIRTHRNELYDSRSSHGHSWGGYGGSDVHEDGTSGNGPGGNSPSGRSRGRTQTQSWQIRLA